MKQLKNFMLAAALMMTPFVVSAQEASEENNGFRSYTFVQAQGGLHIPFTSGSLSDLVKPNFSFNLGHWFAPVVGARLAVEGFGSKAKIDEEYEGFNYLGFNVDGLFNLSPIITKRNYTKHNLYLLAGVGFNHIYGQDDLSRSNRSSFAHNLRFGLGYEYRIIKPLSVSLEYRVNSTADYFNTKQKGSDDWFSSLLLGVSYRFGFSKKVWADNRLASRVPASLGERTLAEKRDMAVNERMNTWVKRMKGESKADYLTRTSDEAIETQRLAFGREYATAAAMASSIGIAGANARYNEAMQALVIDPSENMPSIMLSVPKDEAGKLDVNNLRFENTKYDITGDNQFEVIYTEAIDVKTGQRYVFNKANGTLETESGFISLADYQLKEKEAQIMANNAQLTAAQTNAAQKTEEKTYNLKNTSITREVLATTNPNGTSDYTVSYKYTVKDEFSVKDDFAVGQYDAEKTASSRAMLNLITKQLSEDFAKHIESGKSLEIKYHGTADSKPINRGIAYNGKYGDIIDQPVTINGKQEKLSVTKAEGITTNKHLSLLRAVSVQKFINKNVDSLKKVKVKESYDVEVFPNEGGQYRRVSVDFIFHDTSL